MGLLSSANLKSRTCILSLRVITAEEGRFGTRDSRAVVSLVVPLPWAHREFQPSLSTGVE